LNQETQPQCAAQCPYYETEITRNICGYSLGDGGATRKAAI